MQKILLIVLFTPLVGFSKETNLYCKGSYSNTIDHKTDTYERELNFSFDDKRKTFSTDNRLLCNDFNQIYPLKVTALSFSESEIIFSHQNDQREEGRCKSNFSLNRVSGNLTTLQIIGDIYNPAILIEGYYKCEIAKPKF
ncbi:hypothetical protein MCEMSEM29_01922 [Methylophilaceae bacterium]